MSPDFINGLFELVGGLLVLTHCGVLLKDKMVKGVSVVATAVFTTWGFWNCFYYPYLDQWWSFAGGLVIVAANFLWVAMMVYYKRYPGGYRAHV